MLEIEGVWWPDDVGLSWAHSLRHVKSLDYAIDLCKKRRTAVQAGGNIGLWPKKMAKCFQHVHTFEPDPQSRECLLANVASRNNVTVHPFALSDSEGPCDVLHSGLGSHHIVSESSQFTSVASTKTVDSYNFTDVDLLQLDVEGYEWHALVGAWRTVQRYHPVIQLEYRNFTARYGKSDAMIDEMLVKEGYKLVSRQPGSDVVYAHA